MSHVANIINTVIGTVMTGATTRAMISLYDGRTERMSVYVYHTFVMEIPAVYV